MVEILEKLQYYLQFPFVIYAFIVGVLIALCSSLLGVTLVLKRFSYIGDGLSHVAYGSCKCNRTYRQNDNYPACYYNNSNFPA